MLGCVAHCKKVQYDFFRRRFELNVVVINLTLLLVRCDYVQIMVGIFGVLFLCRCFEYLCWIFNRC